MPHGSRLIGAIGYALTIYIAQFYFREQMEYDGVVGNIVIVWGMCIAALCGWYILGKKPEFGGWASLSAGIRGMLGTMVWISIIYGMYYVFKGMQKGIYSDPVEMLVIMFNKILQIFISGFQPEIGIILLIGALIIGRLAGLANKYWE